MGIFENVEQKKSGLFSDVGVDQPSTPGFSLTSQNGGRTQTSTPAMTDYGTSQLISDVMSFGKDIFTGADYTTGGVARNTILGLPKAAKDVFFPTRGFTEEELKNAKPTFGERVMALPKYAAEFESSLGNLVGSVLTGPLSEYAKTPTGSLFADVGAELEKLGKPQTAGEASAMRVGDVVNVLPIGSLKVSSTAAEAIARSKNAAEIFNLLKGEVPDLADNAAEQYARILTQIDDANQVQRILNKTEFTLKGGRDLTETKGLTLFNDKPATTENVPTIVGLQRKIKGLEEIRNARPSDVGIMNELKNAKNQLAELQGKQPKFPTVHVDGIGDVPVMGTVDSITGKITYDQNLPDEVIPHDIQEQADTDWTNNYAEEYGKLTTQVDELQQELKKTNAAGRDAIEQKINELNKKGTQLEDEFLNKWKGEPQTKIQERLDQLDLEEYNLDMQEEYLMEHPINQLKKYEAKSGEFKGELMEVKGVGKNKFAREGDQMADELGMTSEEARVKYNEIKTRKIELRREKAQLKNERRNLKEILKIAKTSKSRAGSVSSYNSPQPSGQFQESLTQEQTLEKTARELLESSNLEGDLGSASLDTIIQQAQIPVEKKVNILDYMRTPENVLKKIGLENEANYLRQQYEKYLKELPKNIDKITEWYNRVPKESNERIFDWLDGKAVDLNPNEKQVGNEIKQWLKEWADRLDLPEDNRVTYYITHLFDEQLIKKEFDQDLAKIIENKIAGEVYDPFLEKRLGAKGYKRDTWAALDAYAKRATRKVYMDPALEKMKAKAPSLELSQWKYLKQYIDRVNMRPTNIDNLIDNGLKTIFGYRAGIRPTTAITATLRRFTYRAMLGLNMGSALRNISQGINTYAKLGEKYTMIGYAKLLSKSNHKELEVENILSQGVVQDRVMSATKKAVEKIDKGLYIFFETAERINRGAAYFGAKSKALAEGKTEQQAIEYGKKIVRETQFTFGSIDTPVAMGSDILKMFSQFQTYTTKQIEFLAEMAKNKEFLGLVRYAVAGLAFVYTIGQAFGMDKKELIPIYRFGVPPSMKFPWEVGKAIMGAPDAYGRPRNWSQRGKDILKTLSGLIPAGTQMKKSFEGYQAMQQGVSTNSAGTKQFEVGGTLAKDAQAVLFGKYAGQGAKAYYNDQVSYAESQYEKLLKSKTPKEDFERIIKTDPNLARNILKIKEQRDMGVTEDDKKLLGMDNTPRAKFLYDQFNSLKTKEEKAKLWNDYVKKKIITKDVAQKIGELVKNPPKKEPINIKSIINTILGIKTAHAEGLPATSTDVWVRDNRVSHNDLYEAAAILFGEISNRDSKKQMLEARTILNTAFNRMDQYRAKGQEKTLTEVLQMDNQYQAFKGKQYDKFKKGGITDPESLRKIQSISDVIGEVLDGTLQNNIGDYVFYKHLADGRIVASPGKLFK